MMFLKETSSLRDQSLFKLEGGGGEERLGGLQFLFGWNMGGLKMPKDDLGVASSFF